MITMCTSRCPFAGAVVACRSDAAPARCGAGRRAIDAKPTNLTAQTDRAGGRNDGLDQRRGVSCDLRTVGSRSVSKLTTATKRLLVGRPFRSDRLAHTLLPKRIALPVFASDALSSVAYAPQEIFADAVRGRAGRLRLRAVDRRAGRPGHGRRGAVLPAERARLPQRRRRLRGRHQEPRARPTACWSPARCWSTTS